MGSLVLISAPSGCGKTSLLKSLISELKQDSKVAVSISYTTRKPRPGEVNGIDYNFIDDETFVKMIEENVFLEWADVFGFKYGTSKKDIEQMISEGFTVFMTIDWQGAAQIRKIMDTKSIFILPPSIDALRERLISRGQDSAEVINTRLSQSQSDITHKDEYDFIVVNDKFEDALEELIQIVKTK